MTGMSGPKIENRLIERKILTFLVSWRDLSPNFAQIFGNHDPWRGEIFDFHDFGTLLERGLDFVALREISEV